MRKFFRTYNTRFKEMIDENILKQTTPNGLKAVLEEFQTDIEAVRVDEQLDRLERNRLLLTYYSKVEEPFLTGDTVKVFYRQDLRKFTLKTPYLGASAICLHWM